MSADSTKAENEDPTSEEGWDEWFSKNIDPPPDAKLAETTRWEDCGREDLLPDVDLWTEFYELENPTHPKNDARVAWQQFKTYDPETKKGGYSAKIIMDKVLTNLLDDAKTYFTPQQPAGPLNKEGFTAENTPSFVETVLAYPGFIISTAKQKATDTIHTVKTTATNTIHGFVNGYISPSLSSSGGFAVLMLDISHSFVGEQAALWATRNSVSVVKLALTLGLSGCTGIPPAEYIGGLTAGWTVTRRLAKLAAGYVNATTVTKTFATADCFFRRNKQFLMLMGMEHSPSQAVKLMYTRTLGKFIRRIMYYMFVLSANPALLAAEAYRFLGRTISRFAALRHWNLQKLAMYLGWGARKSLRSRVWDIIVPIYQRRLTQLRRLMEPKSPPRGIALYANKVTGKLFGGDFFGRRLRYPDASEWPSIGDARFNVFVGQLLTNRLPGYRTRDLTVFDVPARSGCHRAAQLETYQQILPVLVGKNSPLDRLLYVASTGSGKTCGAHAMVAALCLEGGNRAAIIVPTETARIQMYSQALVCPGPIKTALVNTHNLSWDNEAHRAQIKSFLSQKFELLTYAQAGSHLADDASYFDGRAIFIEEVHNIVDSPELVNGKLHPTYQSFPSNRQHVSTLYHLLGKAKKSVIVGMTATPIPQRPEQIAMLTNFLAGSNKINPDTFMAEYIQNGHITTNKKKLKTLRTALRGFISIYNNQHDTHQFASVKAYDTEVPYSEQQEQKMADGNVFADHKEKLVNVVPQEMQDWNCSQLGDDVYLRGVSPKFLAIANTIRLNKGKGKQLVYSEQARTGAQAIRDILLKRGMHPVTTRLPKKDGLIYLCDSSLTRKEIGKRVALFNRDPKANHVMIIGPREAEGLDLKGVRTVHFVEQPKDPGRYHQVVGRARRYCAHKAFKHPNEWTLDVHTYTARSRQPGAPEPDRVNRTTRDVNDQLNNEVLAVAGSVSLDCEANKKRTGFVCESNLGEKGRRARSADRVSKGSQRSRGSKGSQRSRGSKGSQRSRMSSKKSRSPGRGSK